MMKPLMVAVCCFNVLGQSTPFASAQERPETTTTALHINPVQQPWNFRQVARQCMYTSDECRGAIEAIGSYVGIPPGAIVETMRTADSLGLGVSLSHQGEEYTMRIDPPPGYHVCNARVNMTSLAPANGKYSPTFSFRVSEDGVDNYNFVHKLKAGQGRSWVDAILIVVFEKDGSNAFERCVGDLTSREFVYSCKGVAGGNGLPGCGSVDWVAGSPGIIENPNETQNILHNGSGNWVYLGRPTSSNNWATQHFRWSGALPIVGETIIATSDVNIRSNHIQQGADGKWENARRVGGVTVGQRVAIREVKDVTAGGGYFWARISN